MGAYNYVGDWQRIKPAVTTILVLLGSNTVRIVNAAWWSEWHYWNRQRVWTAYCTNGLHHIYTRPSILCAQYVNNSVFVAALCTYLLQTLRLYSSTIWRMFAVSYVLSLVCSAKCAFGWWMSCGTGADASTEPFSTASTLLIALRWRASVDTLFPEHRVRCQPFKQCATMRTWHTCFTACQARLCVGWRFVSSNERTHFYVHALSGKAYNAYS